MQKRRTAESCFDSLADYPFAPNHVELVDFEGGFDQNIWVGFKRNAAIAQTASGSRHGGASSLEQSKVFRAVIAAFKAPAVVPVV